MEQERYGAPLVYQQGGKAGDSTVISYRYLDMDNTFTLPFIDDASIENSLNCLAHASI